MKVNIVKKEAVLGIDIGGTNTVFGVMEQNGNYIFKDSIPTIRQEKAEKLFTRLFDKFNKHIKILPEIKIIGVGIGAPNANYYKGTVENPVNLNWGVVDVVNLVKKYIDLPIFITNDANIAAIGEMKFGAAKGLKNFIEITLGTGVGSGVIVNGDLVYGQDGFAGELGHVIVEKNGRKCGCGRRGCLEAYASASGIVRNAYNLLVNDNNDSKIANIPFSDLTSKIIYDFAIEGDLVAKQAFEVTGEYLGRAFADFTAIFCPEAIIIYGGIARAGDILLNPIKKHLEDNVMEIFKGKVKIIESGLSEEDIAVMGAGAFCWHKLKK